MKEIIFTKTKLPYGWLGNMFASPIEYDGRIWRTGEALFQALRFEENEYRELIRNQKSPIGAKLKAKSNKDKMIVTPTSDKDVDNMRLVLSIKFKQHTDLSKKLKETDPYILIEDVSTRKRGNSTFWGAYNNGEEWIGQNILGKLLMELRDEL